MQVKNGRLILSDGAAARYVPTKKKGGRLNPVGIVMHYTAGYTTEGDVATLATSDRKASAHVVVGRDGEIVQIVPFDEEAWHAGPSLYHPYTLLNRYTIGIEISNIGYLKRIENHTYTDSYGNDIDGDGQFIGKNRKLKSAPKGWLHERHPRLGSGMYAWEPYYPAQLDAVGQLFDALITAYPDIEFVVSHEEIDTRKWKTDPGPAFPMKLFKHRLEQRGKGYVFPDKPAMPTKPAVFDDTELVKPTPPPTPAVSAAPKEPEKPSFWRRMSWPFLGGK